MSDERGINSEKKIKTIRIRERRASEERTINREPITRRRARNVMTSDKNN